MMMDYDYPLSDSNVYRLTSYTYSCCVYPGIPSTSLLNIVQICMKLQLCNGSSDYLSLNVYKT